jgi:hypothetical protein
MKLIGGTPSLDIKLALTKFPDLASLFDIGASLFDIGLMGGLLIGGIIYPR